MLPCLLVVGCFPARNDADMYVVMLVVVLGRQPLGTMGFVGRSRQTQDDDLQLVRWYSYTSIALCRYVPSTRLRAFKN